MRPRPLPRRSAWRLPTAPVRFHAGRRTFRQHSGPERRLRVGLLSGSLRAHPVGWLTVAAFEALDEEAFELVCLVQASATDPISRRFRARAAAWEPVDSLNDEALAAFARSLGIDLLIDLGGYGDLGRLPACARRLAPVQLNGSACNHIAPACPRWTGS